MPTTKFTTADTYAIAAFAANTQPEAYIVDYEEGGRAANLHLAEFPPFGWEFRVERTAPDCVSMLVSFDEMAPDDAAWSEFPTMPDALAAIRDWLAVSGAVEGEAATQSA